MESNFQVFKGYRFRRDLLFFWHLSVTQKVVKKFNESDFPKCLFRIRKAEPGEVTSGSLRLLTWIQSTTLQGIFFEGNKIVLCKFGEKDWSPSVIFIIYFPICCHGHWASFNRSIEIRGFQDAHLRMTTIWGCQSPTKRPTRQLYAKVYLSRNNKRKRRSKHQYFNISKRCKMKKWRELQKDSNLIHLSIIHWGIKLPKVQLVKSLVAWCWMVIHGYQQGIHQKGCVFVPSAWSKWLSPHLWGSPQACTLRFQLRTLGQQWQTGNSTLVHNEYMYVYIYRICSFILGPSRPHTFWVLCEMVVPRMPNTRCTKTYMSDGNGKKKQEVHQQSSIPFHPPVLIPPVDGALHAMLSRLGSSTISSTCTAKQPRLTSWHGKCSRNSTPIRSNPTFVSSFAACNGLQSIRSIKKKQKTITKNKEKRQTQNLQKARKNIMEGKSLTYLLKENSNW